MDPERAALVRALDRASSEETIARILDRLDAIEARRRS
jgi:hypothetical protein